MYYYYDSSFLLLIPAILFALYAQVKVHRTMNKYKKIPSKIGLTGKEAAEKILKTEGLANIPVGMTTGKIGDHYDPIKKMLNLSHEVYEGKSVTAIAVVAHEAGHAIQDLKQYRPLVLRTTMYPMVSFSSWLGPILFIVGFIFTYPPLITIGIYVFAASVVFSLITLPVEFDASKRALVLYRGLFNPGNEEMKGAKKVLSAAALTYVAAALMAVLQLIRLILLAKGRD